MSKDDLNRQAALQITIGHLLILGDVLASKPSSSGFLDALPKADRQAILVLQDLCESELVDFGNNEMARLSWEDLMKKARAFVKTMPVEFLH